MLILFITDTIKITMAVIKIPVCINFKIWIKVLHNIEFRKAILQKPIKKQIDINNVDIFFLL